MTATENDALQNELKTKQICRFCLSQQLDKLGSIYQRDTRLKSSAPLPVQVMACASIEVFTNDGMPSKVCCDCRLLFEHAYRFKQMCKRADTLLRQFPLVGQWPIPLAKPKFPKELVPLKSTAVVTPPQQQRFVTSATSQSPSKSLSPLANKLKKGSEVAPPKILNAYPVNSPEPPMPIRMKKEKLDEETTIFLNKVENNEELSIDDVQRLIAAADNDKVEYVEDQNESASALTISMPPPSTPKSKPKLLNKSSIRILNRDAEIVLEPRLSAPQLKRDVDGNMAIVTEILDPDTPYETEQDPAKNAAPVETVVFPCPHCERSFPLRQLRDIHMVNHTRNRSFQCPDCEKSFFSKYDLQKHSLIHTGDRPFKCTVCEKSFTRANLLHRHEKTHTDIPKFICLFCEKPFISKEQMDKHTERHLKNRPYQCSVCSKSFAFKQGLERHEVVHSREQPYPCQYCEQSFSTPSKLARHLTAHAGKRPYPCKFCPKSYLLSHHLTRHLRSHKNGTFTFLCSDCEKVFNSRDELIYHSAVHATQTLVCPLCKDTFKDIESVTVHIKEHAEGDAFACEFCDLIFMTAERLQQHTDEDHIGDMAAYREDDALNATEKIVKERSKSIENVGITEETIEEFLVDELPDCRKYSSNNEIIKTEEEWDDQPKIINEIVFKTKLNASDEENLMLLDESNIIVANEGDVVEYALPEQQPPAKMRKVVASMSQPIIKNVERQKWPPSFTSPVLRRKATQASDTPAPKSKIEKQIIATSATNSSINSVLKMIPKGVSVRRNPSNNDKISSQPQHQQTKNETRVVNKVTLNSATSNNRPQSIGSKASPSNTGASSCQSTNKKSPGTTQHPGDTKTIKMMLGDKKVKVQKITITKAEAAAMAKDGRIRMKDGAMVLTKAVK